MDYANASDTDLMEAYQKGDTLAFEILFNRYQKGIYNFLYRYLRGAQATDEGFQEVFLRVVKSSPNYTPQAKFSTWIYTIARNYCIDQSRKNRLRRVMGSLEDQSPRLEGEGLNWQEKVEDHKPLPDSQVSAKDISGKMEEVLETLNPDQKEVFILREKQELSFDEIAEIVGASVSTVKSRMRYALNSLKKEFSDLGLDLN